MKILTISIAAYNVEKFIENTLDSLVDTRIMDDIEVLIVNDGSSDNTKQLASSYENKYPNTFKLINKENGGYGSTINTSLKIATGKYYKLLDGDDWYDTEQLVKLLEVLKECTSDLVIIPNIEVVDETGEQTKIKPFENVVEGEEFTYEKYPKGNRISMHQACFRTKAIQNKGIEIREHCFYTDTEYLLKSMSKCKTIIYYDIPVYMYRVGLDEQSMSVAGIRKHYKDAVKYYKEMIRYRKEEDIDNDFEKQYLTDAMTSLARYHLTMFLMLDSNRKKEYIEFEKYIKDNAMDIYMASNCASLNILRKTKNIMYKPLCWRVNRKMKNAIRA